MDIRVTFQSSTRKTVEQMITQAEQKGDLQEAKRLQAVLSVGFGYPYAVISAILGVSERSIGRWVHTFILKGPDGLKSKKSPGRKPRLTKTQRKELSKYITEGPEAAGFPGACWRSPMIQTLIYEKFGIFYSVNYISQLLKNMGFSYQKAAFVADKQDAEARKRWLEQTWPEILEVAEKKKALILFGDECSFPQWGTLTYTWAKKGEQPIIKTCGKRKSYKVFGLIEYFTGQFFCKGHESSLNSASYSEFLKEVMKKMHQHLIIIQDGARYHTSKFMEEFFKLNAVRLTVYQMPSYSPDYNPIERLWKKIKEKETHLHYFPTFDALKQKVNQAILRFENLKDEVLSLFRFYRSTSETAEVKMAA